MKQNISTSSAWEGVYRIDQTSFSRLIHLLSRQVDGRIDQFGVDPELCRQPSRPPKLFLTLAKGLGTSKSVILQLFTSSKGYYEIIASPSDRPPLHIFKWWSKPSHSTGGSSGSGMEGADTGGKYVVKIFDTGGTGHKRPIYVYIGPNTTFYHYKWRCSMRGAINYRIAWTEGKNNQTYPRPSDSYGL